MALIKTTHATIGLLRFVRVNTRLFATEVLIRKRLPSKFIARKEKERLPYSKTVEKELEPSATNELYNLLQDDAEERFPAPAVQRHVWTFDQVVHALTTNQAEAKQVVQGFLQEAVKTTASRQSIDKFKAEITEIQQLKPEFKTLAFNSLIEVYLRLHKYDDARKEIKNARAAQVKFDGSTWNKIMRLYGQTNQFDLANQIFAQMEKEGIRPTQRNFNTAMEIAAKQKDYEKIFDLYNEMQTHGFEPNEFTYSMMFWATNQAERPEAACRYYRQAKNYKVQLSHKSVYFLMRSLLHAPHTVDDVFDVLNDMAFMGLKPTTGIVNLLFDACKHRVDVVKANQLWDEYFPFSDEDKEFTKLVPSFVSYTNILSCYAVATQKFLAQQWDNMLAKENPDYELAMIAKLSREADVGTDEDESENLAKQSRHERLKQLRVSLNQKKLQFVSQTSALALRSALEKYQQFLNITPDALNKHPMVHLEMMRVLCYHKMIGRAEEHFRNCLMKLPEDVVRSGFNVLADMLTNSNLENALDRLLKVKQEAKIEFDARNHLKIAKFLSRQNRVDEAITYIEAMAKLSPPSEDNQPNWESVALNFFRLDRKDLLQRLHTAYPRFEN